MSRCSECSKTVDVDYEEILFGCSSEPICEGCQE